MGLTDQYPHLFTKVKDDDPFIKKAERKNSQMRMEYHFGTLMVEFLVSRGLITLKNDLNLTTTYTKKKNKSDYIPKSLYARIPKSLYALCNIDMN